MRISQLYGRVRVVIRRALRLQDPPNRIARGAAAGFFVAAFPLPGLQIPLSLCAAWLARGNKAVAILPQFLSNAVTMIPLAFLELKVGARLWPARAAEIGQGTEALRAAAAEWRWSAPISSLMSLAGHVGSLGGDVLGPLTVGVLVVGVSMAALSYPATLALVRFWRAKREQRRAMRERRNRVEKGPVL